jgi:hypothetical protein
MKGMDYSRLVVPLAAAVQELAQERDAQKAKIASLEARLGRMEKALERLGR